jgi:RNA polymerase sigma factor (sigma-70 family)
MSSSDTTCWTVIRSAAGGEEAARTEFARRYEPIIRAYLGARWRRQPLGSEVDDAVQEVFFDCFKQGGVLFRADSARNGGFRAFLYGVIRKTALQFERNTARRKATPADESLEMDRFPTEEEGLSTVFDRAWATAILREAADRQAELARALGSDGMRRVELLELRFGEGLPIRDIAVLFDADPAHLHREYAKARIEFRAALKEVVSFHHAAPGPSLDDECSRLLDLL